MLKNKKKIFYKTVLKPGWDVIEGKGYREEFWVTLIW